MNESIIKGYREEQNECLIKKRAAQQGAVRGSESGRPRVTCQEVKRKQTHCISGRSSMRLGCSQPHGTTTTRDTFFGSTVKKCACRFVLNLHRVGALLCRFVSLWNARFLHPCRGGYCVILLRELAVCTNISNSSLGSHYGWRTTRPVPSRVNEGCDSLKLLPHRGAFPMQ
jgi:hypothetical protein